MKIGLIFAGQGAQYPGMGRELYNHSVAAQAVFHTAGDEVTSWCFEGTKELLKETRVTQPTVYTVSMAAYAAFCETLDGINKNSDDAFEISGVAGFSLGEYAALTAAKSIEDIKKGIRIVQARGLMMNDAGTGVDGRPKGGMMAALASRDDVLACVEQTRGNGILCGVNFNGPKQTVVAGDFEALERFKTAASDRKMRVIPVSVGTAFHSPMMEPAAAKLKELLLKEELKAPQMRLYCDVTAQDLMSTKPADTDTGIYIAELMSKQAMSPVYWQEIIENMIEDGVKCFVELGPGKTLSGMVKKINSGVATCNVEDMESLAATIDKLKELQAMTSKECE